MLRLTTMTLAVWAGVIAAAETPSLSPSPDGDRLILRGVDGVTAATLFVSGNAQGTTLGIEPGPEGETHLTSRWPLMSGVAYSVAAETDRGTLTVPITLPAESRPQPGVRAIAPDVPVVPSNLLRFHIFFDSPMAPGQAYDHLRLSYADGTPVPHAFLELGVEIWSPDQRRLTILFDPGRIKHGVGPNRALGPPLIEGESYLLEFLPGMTDVPGTPIETDFRHPFEVGPPETSVLSTNEWILKRTEETLTIGFGRVMDAASVARHLVIVAEDGRILRPDPNMERPTWNLSHVPLGTSLRMLANPLLEDAAGNTLCAPFEAEAGALTRCHATPRFEIEITR